MLWGHLRILGNTLPANPLVHFQLFDHFMATQEFILIILMVIWTSGLYELEPVGILRTINPQTKKTPFHFRYEAYDWLEFFAGNAACTTCARLQGYRGCKFDLKYNPDEKVPHGSTNFMDLNSASGFMSFGGNSVTCARLVWVCSGQFGEPYSN